MNKKPMERNEALRALADEERAPHILISSRASGEPFKRGTTTRQVFPMLWDRHDVSKWERECMRVSLCWVE